ncbi:hypothetical protein BH23CHL5_BH23CHL5_14500 [soil metagenome]
MSEIADFKVVTYAVPSHVVPGGSRPASICSAEYVRLIRLSDTPRLTNATPLDRRQSSFLTLMRRRDRSRTGRRTDTGPSSAEDALPRWTDAGSSTKVPPFVREPGRSVWPQLEVALKLMGVLMILTAMVAAGLMAMPDRQSDGNSTPTADAAMVMVPKQEVPFENGSPVSPGSEITNDQRFSGMTICLDPGHGGNDRGFQRVATAAAPAMDESYFSLAIAKDLQAKLEQRGFSVVLTRSETEANPHGLDTNRDGKTPSDGSSPEEAQQFAALDEVQARIDRCNDSRSTLILSIHLGDSIDVTERGSTVWYSDDRDFSPYNQLFATLVLEELVLQLQQFGSTSPGSDVKPVSPATGTDLWSVGEEFLLLAPDHEVLKEPSLMPAVIAEVLMISNDEDAAIVGSAAGVQAVSVSLDRAIIRFIDLANLT